MDWALLGTSISLGSLLGITFIAIASTVVITAFRKGTSDDKSIFCTTYKFSNRNYTVLRHIGRESRAETVTEQQEMDIHVSKNAVYEVVRNSYAYNFMMKDNVAYSGTVDLEAEYEYI